jgi:hypothetical protein
VKKTYEKTGFELTKIVLNVEHHDWHWLQHAGRS